MINVINYCQFSSAARENKREVKGVFIEIRHKEGKLDKDFKRYGLYFYFSVQGNHTFGRMKVNFQ